MDLIWRSFFQEAEEDEGMNMKFKMHDLIHDLAQLVSRIECALVDSNAKNVNEKFVIYLFHITRFHSLRRI